MRLQLCVRKWFCGNRACRRRIFTERLPTITAPWARRTRRLAQRLVAVGLALGGKAGVSLSQRWGLAVSRNTLLRLLRRQPAPSFPTPTVLGVDDFALRTIATSRPQRDVYYACKEMGPRSFSLPLGPRGVLAMAANTASDHELMDALLAREGPEGFAAAWYRYHGDDEAATVLERSAHGAA